MIGAWIRRGSIALLLFAAFSPFSQAQQTFEDGVAAYGRKDYTNALSIFTPLAERGDAAAQAYLGAMYSRGDGVARDHDEAAKWLLQAAEQGHAEAQYSLGIMYVKGWIEAQHPDDPEEPGGETDDPDIATDEESLGTAVFWFRGGTPRGYAEGVQWFHRAAERGLAVAQYNLATLYAGGLAVQQDFLQAHKWFSLVIASLPPGEVRTKMVGAQEMVERDMSPAQIAEARRLAHEWQPKSE